MTMSAGKTEYVLGATPVSGIGVSYLPADLEESLTGSVVNVVFDDTGVADITTLLESVADTDFEREQLKRIIEDDYEPEPWQVGEGLAECYLNHHRDCCFPWPDNRDIRKAGSSLPGADLVGFKDDGGTSRFTFGEVKTSGQNKYPPTDMYGRTGLKKQLEDLRDNVDIRDDLVKYIGYRAPKASWKANYIAASERYLHNNTDVSLFGILVRDVGPNENDLRERVDKLGKGCPIKMSIELMAIYLPPNSIKTLGTRTIAIRKGGKHNG